jgi:phage-related protein
MGTQSIKNKKKSKIDKALEKLSDEFDEIQSTSVDFDISKHLATIDDLPDLGQIELYDYDADLKIAGQKGIDVLESLVDLYLGEFPELKKNSYINNKMKEDALVYAETIFLQKMTRKNFLTQLRQVDNGDNSSRMHEVINQTIKEIRENSKFASTMRSDLERFYKELKSDIMEVSESSMSKPEEEEEGQVIDPKKLNDMINQAITKNKN